MTPRNEMYRLRRAFEDRVAIVTGGTSGIGRALCLALGRLGATVVVAGRNMDRADEVVNHILQYGGRAYAARVDVTVQEEVVELVEQTRELQSRVDYMFNNAGVAILGEAQDISIERWRWVMDVNLWGAVYGTMAAYDVMREQGDGHIVNLSSVQGIVPFAGSTPYCASKHAVVGYSLGLRAEAAEFGVRVTVVCPDAVQSNLVANTPTPNLPGDRVQAWAGTVKHVDADRAAYLILHGVARNRTFVVFPARIRALWRLYRLAPAGWIGLGALIVRRIRREVTSWRQEAPAETHAAHA